MFSRFTLGIIGIAYFIFGIWCAIDAQFSSAWLGHMIEDNPDIRMEFFVMYAGVAVALGVVFLITAFVERFTVAGLILAIAFHVTKVLVRIIAILAIVDVGSSGKIMFGIEAFMALLSVFAMAFYRPSHHEHHLSNY